MTTPDGFVPGDTSTKVLVGESYAHSPLALKSSCPPSMKNRFPGPMVALFEVFVQRPSDAMTSSGERARQHKQKVAGCRPERTPMEYSISVLERIIGC